MTADRLEEVRDFIRIHDELRLLDAEQLRDFASRPSRRWLGRFVRCPAESRSSTVDDILLPGIVLTRRLDDSILVFQDRARQQAVAIRGHPELLVPLLDVFSDLHFALTATDRSWRIASAEPRHVRIEGAIWTTFFPWGLIGRSFVLGCIVSVIAAVAMYEAYGEFWVRSAGPGSTDRRVEETFAAIAAPGLLAGFMSFVSLTRLEPGEERSPGFWVSLCTISGAAILVAVVLSFVHQPFNAGH